MKSKLFVLGAASLLFAACTEELQLPDSQVLGGGGEIPLQISVNEQPITKVTGLCNGTSLVNGSELGVFLTTEDDLSYDSKDYDNIKFTATGSGAEQTWAFDEATPVILSATSGKVYAYYPRQESGASLTSITISDDGNDWMYTPAAASNVSIYNPMASLSMEHAMTIIRVNVVGSNEASTGTVSELTLNGSGWARSATLNLKNWTIGSYMGSGSRLAATDLGALSTTGLSHDFWVVSNLTASVITFIVKVDENYFKVNTPAEVTLERGKVYTYVLNVENPKSASLSSVSTEDWTAKSSVNFDAKTKTVFTWDEAKKFDGVYGMTADGKAKIYRAVSSTTDNLVGAAFVVRGKAYQVSKKEAASICYWQKSNRTDIPELTNYETADGTSSSLSIHEDANPYTWNEGAISDFNGQSNTNAIITAQDNGTMNYSIGKIVFAFRGDNNYNEGYTDWFVPSCGELAYMLLKIEELSKLLQYVGGSSLYGGFWCSSEFDIDKAWVVSKSSIYSNIRVVVKTKNTFLGMSVRLIREI